MGDEPNNDQQPDASSPPPIEPQDIEPLRDRPREDPVMKMILPDDLLKSILKRKADD